MHQLLFHKYVILIPSVEVPHFAFALLRLRNGLAPRLCPESQQQSCSNKTILQSWLPPTNSLDLVLCLLPLPCISQMSKQLGFLNQVLLDFILLRQQRKVSKGAERQTLLI
jgi:hypothetical protein